ncbi:hypothetical protein [Mucilaginibacter sp. dw_454]|uniref:hypothetical protein n=1 Tax=Mucilaginibacter sp. dw_454 TaxID=2720079 RepID=UPI001BD684EE|nr:hypothetical protein [Mucilaginibacter sp. dw_454]
MANPSTIHDTVRVVKVIVDTVRVSSKDSLDLMNKMDSFYNNAWNKLIFFFSVIGIGVPIAVQWYQKKQLKLSKDQLYSEIEADRKIAEIALKEFFNKSIDDAKVELKQEIGKEKEYLSNSSDGAAFHLQALMHQTSDPDIAVYSSVEGAKKYLKAGSSRRASACLSIAEDTIKATTKQKIDEIFKLKAKKDFKSTLAVAADLNSDNEDIAKVLSALEKEYNKLPE